jgi:glycosyltransferase involved in cell wall biosynthesis
MITIITVCYNAGPDLQRTLNSCSSQIDTDFQHLIIDGGSQDNTAEIVFEYSRIIKDVIFLSESDKGIYDAMNKAIKLLDSGWVLFLNAGDLFFSSDIIQNYKKILIENPDKAIVWGDIAIYSHKLENDFSIVSQEFCPLIIIKNICHQSIFYNFDCIGELLRYNTEYKVCADFELLLTLHIRFSNQYFYKVNDLPVVKYLAGGYSEREVFSRLKERKFIIRRSNISMFKKIINLLNVKRLYLLHKLKMSNLFF